MSKNTSVATPIRTGMVSSNLRSRYLDINLQALHQLRESLPGQSERGGGVAAVAGRSGEGRAHKTLLELNPGHVERLQTIGCRGARDGCGHMSRADDPTRRHRNRHCG